MMVAEAPALSDRDMSALSSQSDAALACWWATLNKWGWPEGLPDPEHERESRGRRGEIMDWINAKIGHRACLREWNRRMTESEFDDLWRGVFEGDPEARRRNDARLYGEAQKPVKCRCWWKPWTWIPPPGRGG